MNTHINPVLDHAPTATYAAAGSTFVLWGLHLSDIAVILSALATMAGVALQFYVALHRIRMLEKAQVVQAAASVVNSARIGAVEEQAGDAANAAQVAVSAVRTIAKGK